MANPKLLFYCKTCGNKSEQSRNRYTHNNDFEGVEENIFHVDEPWCRKCDTKMVRSMAVNDSWRD